MNFKKYGIWLITLIIVCLSWIGLEYALDGEIITQASDNIIALILSYLIADKIYYTYI